MLSSNPWDLIAEKETAQARAAPAASEAKKRNKPKQQKEVSPAKTVSYDAPWMWESWTAAPVEEDWQEVSTRKAKGKSAAEEREEALSNAYTPVGDVEVERIAAKPKRAVKKSEPPTPNKYVAEPIKRTGPYIEDTQEDFSPAKNSVKRTTEGTIGISQLQSNNTFSVLESAKPTITPRATPPAVNTTLDKNKKTKKKPQATVTSAPLKPPGSKPAKVENVWVTNGAPKGLAVDLGVEKNNLDPGNRRPSIGSQFPALTPSGITPTIISSTTTPPPTTTIITPNTSSQPSAEELEEETPSPTPIIVQDERFNPATTVGPVGRGYANERTEGNILSVEALLADSPTLSVVDLHSGIHEKTLEEEQLELMREIEEKKRRVEELRNMEELRRREDARLEELRRREEQRRMSEGPMGYHPIYGSIEGPHLGGNLGLQGMKGHGVQHVEQIVYQPPMHSQPYHPLLGRLPYDPSPRLPYEPHSMEPHSMDPLSHGFFHLGLGSHPAQEQVVHSEQDLINSMMMDDMSMNRARLSQSTSSAYNGMPSGYSQEVMYEGQGLPMSSHGELRRSGPPGFNGAARPLPPGFGGRGNFGPIYNPPATMKTHPAFGALEEDPNLDEPLERKTPSSYVIPAKRRNID
ncbi:proteoglycan 4 [Planoprotostelium fungivorum]|uniref:Proteoglycan 4 n=1 Tax=Planoprotostelium fungivorum TaxID=1890364 RepID=A0A2P6NLL5_9EUKA|nr:proteoglycan 4 [Planoprotostelium fungivorum]